jgi:alkylhydroperoxidase family enzyme
VWSPLQAAVLAWTDAATRGVTVPDEVFGAARALLDDRGLVELAVLAGGYAMVSRVLVAFEVPPPAGEVTG